MQELIDFTNSNPLLVSGLIASGLAVLFYELRLKARGISSLPAAVAVRVINSGAKVVDVRDAGKFADGHIVDARNIPAKELLATADNLKKQTKGTLLVCDNGSQSGECANQLRKQGLENVYSLQGGMAAWQQDNLPVVRAGSKDSD